MDYWKVLFQLVHYSMFKNIYNENNTQMKKHSIFTIIFLAIAITSMSQDAKKVTKINKSSFLSFSGGLSIPAGDFSSTIGAEPGYAKTGYNLNLNYGYSINSRVGITSSAFYVFHKLNNKAINDQIGSGGPLPSVSSDHWQYHGLVVGPMTTFELADNVYLDLKFMAGIANVNFPVLKSQGESSPERWRTAYAMRMGGNIRYNFSERFSFYSNLDYAYTRPRWSFTQTIEGESINVDITQRIENVNLNIGIGYLF